MAYDRNGCGSEDRLAPMLTRAREKTPTLRPLTADNAMQIVAGH